MLGRSTKQDSGSTLVRRLQAEIQETGSFSRGDSVRRFPVVTWESTLDGQEKAVKSDDWTSARREFMAVVDEFLNDYLVVNPRIH
jgi:hypothetical protein